MHTIMLDKPGHIRVVESEVPEIRENEVLLEMVYAGLCGTDLGSYRGTNPLVSYPRIPGHEICARIAEKGKEVPATCCIGDLVTASPYSSCGKCTACRKGQSNACVHNQTLGVQRDGAMQQYFVLCWEKLYHSDILKPEELVLTEPLSVGSHAVNRGQVAAGETVLVLGCGTIGMGALIAAVSRGGKIIAADPALPKLDMARKFGALHVINPATENLTEAVFQYTGGEGASVVIEAAGTPASYQAALEAVAYAGKMICIGYAQKDIPLNTSLMVKKELCILGSRNALNEFATVIQVLEARQFPYTSLITAIHPVIKAREVFASWDEDPGASMKILLAF